MKKGCLQTHTAANMRVKAFMTGTMDLVRAVMIFFTARIFPKSLPVDMPSCECGYVLEHRSGAHTNVPAHRDPEPAGMATSATSP